MHFIYRTGKGKEEAKQKNALSEEKKRTVKDMDAAIASFSELVVAGRVLLLRKVEEKVFSSIRSMIFFAV